MKRAEPHPDRVCACIAKECLAMRVRLLNRLITGIYDSSLRPYGLSAAQLGILVAINQKGSVTSSDLERILCLEKSTVSRNLDRMRRKGWLRVEAGEDARSRSVQLTSQGYALLGKVKSAWDEAQRKATELLGEKGAAALCGVADAIPGRRGERR